LTIARGRDAHLRNIVRGLARQSALPRELVIAHMQPAPYADLPDAPFPVRQIAVPGEPVPLAAARNRAAEAAEGGLLAFLDVDCIPDPGFVSDYAAALAPGAGVMMGEVLYLPGGAAEPGWTYEGFAAVAEKHSDRRGPPSGAPEICEDYRCFWSLNFGVRREDFERAGGFDERYVGYGGEDTDFARMLDETGIALRWMKGGRAYHQHHPHHMPPVHHLRTVVANAELFASKWGRRTMEHWLYAFREMGLIEDTPQGLRILREPDDADLALCAQQTHQPFAATRRVLDLLESRRRAIADGEARVREVSMAQAALLRPPGAATAAE
jgi:GT2 family glycosyltransferase